MALILDAYRAWLPFVRPCKVIAGQADGIQPRTIEVFQASQTFFYGNLSSRDHVITPRAMVLLTAC
jgi:hypothetical protein